MRQTSAPERRRSLLANRNLERTHFNVDAKASTQGADDLLRQA